ncbi:MAG: nickel-dependent hydrogenase large subunit, partial [Flavobacteriaceae bacterium]
WYNNQEDGLHPWDEPLPDPAKSQTLHDTDFDGQYSWAKAPRYDGHAVEAGPLARCIMYANPNLKDHQIHDPLFGDIIKKLGPSVFTRVLARVHEAPRLYKLIDQWLSEIDLDGEFYIKPVEKDGKGFGATEAARGSLAHWVEIKDGVIKNYQVMAPTTWNVGPQDGGDNPGPIEAALLDTEIEDPKDPVEVGIVARSFDSCLVCTVHAHDDKSGVELSRFKI